MSGNDTDITPAATTAIIAAAYDRNLTGTPSTSLYVINRVTSKVSVQGGADGVPLPNGGVVADRASLGFTLNAANDGGFDISQTGVGYDALKSFGNLKVGKHSVRVRALTPSGILDQSPATAKWAVKR